MTEIFTQPPAGGAAPGPSQPGGSTDKKLTILIGFSVVFLIAALGTLGWVVLAGGDDGKRVETAQRNEADSERDAATKSADEQSSNDEASGDDSEEAASEEADVTLPKTTVPPPDPVEVTPQVTNVSFERPAAPSIVCTGEPLAYSGAQLVDGDENYGWGASMGDAAGATADMRFVGPVKLATVGLTPGYTRLACAATPAVRRWWPSPTTDSSSRYGGPSTTAVRSSRASNSGRSCRRCRWMSPPPR